jgi:medium-chain acyl-[acyl-carrier-protein] hydrolase
MWPVQLPGRENRFGEKAFSRLEELVPVLAEALLPYMERPYAFWGHSMGALICFELARMLRRERQTPGPIRLAVSGHRAPQLPDPKQPIYRATDEIFLDRLRHLNGTPVEVLEHQELLPLLLPTLRADFELCETYEYRPEIPLDCPISAFGGLNDPDVTRESILAWRDQTHSAFQARFFRGDHFFLHHEPAALMGILSQELLRDLKAM